MGGIPKFDVGDEVVCVDVAADPSGKLRDGERYTVLEANNAYGNVRVSDCVSGLYAGRFRLAPESEPTTPIKAGDTVEITRSTKSPGEGGWVGLRCVVMDDRFRLNPDRIHPHGAIYLRPLTDRSDNGTKNEFFWPTEQVKLVEEVKPRPSESVGGDGLRAENGDLRRVNSEQRTTVEGLTLTNSGQRAAIKSLQLVNSEQRVTIGELRSECGQKQNKIDHLQDVNDGLRSREGELRNSLKLLRDKIREALG